MKKVVSYSLFPTPTYNNIETFFIRGMEWQIETVPKYYPGWEIWLYVDEAVPDNLKSDWSLKGVNIIEKKSLRGGWSGSYWRFLPIANPEVERFISRDLDAMIEWREANAVHEWCSTHYKFHVMRDHKTHGMKVLAGMWGACGNQPEFEKLIMIDIEARPKIEKPDDQKFLSRVVWPKGKDSCLAHDEFFFRNPVHWCAMIKEFPPHPYSHSVTSDIIIDGKNIRERMDKLWQLPFFEKPAYKIAPENGILVEDGKLKVKRI